MTNKPQLSVCILTHDEEENILECIRSASFAEEIVVIDDDSTDKTVEIAQSAGAKVYKRSLAGDFGAQKSFAVEKASCPWVFILDADERFTDELAREVALEVASEPLCCYAVRRSNRFVTGSASHGAMRPDLVVRLFPKEGSFFQGRVHEKLVTAAPQKELKSHLIHYPYKNWESYINKFNRYTTLAAQQYYASGRKCRVLRDIVLRPLGAFVKVYFLRLGFLDGALGFVFSFAHASYTMAKYVKLLAIERGKGRI